jgi:hypothetical protein
MTRDLQSLEALPIEDNGICAISYNLDETKLQADSGVYKLKDRIAFGFFPVMGA